MHLRIALLCFFVPGLAIAVGDRLSGPGWRDTLRRPRAKAWVAVATIAATIGIASLNFELNAIVTAELDPASFWGKVARMPDESGGWIDVVSGIVMVPTAEELLFRGVILSVLLRTRRSTGAIVISAVLFGAAHGTPWHLVTASLLGAWLGWLRVRTGSVWPCVASHALYNTLATVTSNVVPIEAWTRTHEHLPIAVGMAGAAVAAVGTVFIHLGTVQASSTEDDARSALSPP